MSAVEFWLVQLVIAAAREAWVDNSRVSAVQLTELAVNHHAVVRALGEIKR